MKKTQRRTRPSIGVAAIRWMALGVVIVGAGACNTIDKLLSVDARSQIIADKLDDPTQANLLVTSVQSTFECAFGIYIVNVGMLTDELKYFGTSNPMTYYDARFFRDGTGYVGSYGAGSCDATVDTDVYLPLASARWFADDVVRKLEGWTDAEVPNRLSHIGTAAAYAGYSLILLGEAFCTATIDSGPELTPAQVWAAAETRFTSAITAAQTAGNTDILNMARVGRARTRLNLGRPADAAQDAQLVPPTYTKLATASAISRYRRNRPFDQSNTLRNVGVEEPFQNLTEGGVADPRVRTILVPGLRPMHLQDKYRALDTGIPLASGREAQLILAEVQGGAAALTIINTFHAAAGLPAFAGTDPEIMDHLIREERRRELFLESHHMGDMRRYGFPFLPAEGTRYEGGAYSGVYGSTTCLPLPFSEVRSNPNIHR